MKKVQLQWLCSTPSNANNKNSDWAQFLAQRQKRKQLIKEKKDKEIDIYHYKNQHIHHHVHPFNNSHHHHHHHHHHPHITLRKLHKSSTYSPSSPTSPSSPSSPSSSPCSISTPTTDDIDDDSNYNTNDSNGKWIDLYEDVIYHICTFCNFQSLLNISFCCRIWNKYTSFLDETKWRLWYNAINYEMRNISSLDRTGKSNHFIITQNAYDSYDSVYHFEICQIF